MERFEGMVPVKANALLAASGPGMVNETPPAKPVLTGLAFRVRVFQNRTSTRMVLPAGRPAAVVTNAHSIELILAGGVTMEPARLISSIAVIGTAVELKICVCVVSVS